MAKFHINYLNKTPDCLSGVVKLHTQTVINFHFTKNVDSFNLNKSEEEVSNHRKITRKEWDQITSYLKNVSHHHFRGNFLWVD